jgi:hypothetical protein
MTDEEEEFKTAALALAIGMLANPNRMDGPKEIAIQAYDYAEALFAEGNKRYISFKKEETWEK